MVTRTASAAPPGADRRAGEHADDETDGAAVDQAGIGVACQAVKRQASPVFSHTSV